LLSIEVKLSSKIDTIGEFAFEDCTKISSVTIPNGIKKIGKNAFFGCESLEELDIPESVEIIEDGAFSACINLKEVNLSEGLKEINRAFTHNDSLTSIELPDSLESLGGFESCFLLTEINISTNVVEFFRKCLWGGTSIETVYITGPDTDNIQMIEAWVEENLKDATIVRK
jgi:hypothetical protein